MKYSITSDFIEKVLEAHVQGNTVRLSNGEEFTFETSPDEQGVLFLVQGEKRIPIAVIQDGSAAVKLSLNGYTYSIDALSERDRFFRQLLKDTARKGSSAMKVATPMPGLLKSISVKQGQHVKKGERLFILEAMKMENEIKSPMEGVVGVVQATAGTAVEKNFLLCMIETVGVKEESVKEESVKEESVKEV
jgi:biotin carboxyl carrier protein